MPNQLVSRSLDVFTPCDAINMIGKMEPVGFMRNQDHFNLESVHVMPQQNGKPGTEPYRELRVSPAIIKSFLAKVPSISVTVGDHHPPACHRSHRLHPPELIRLCVIIQPSLDTPSCLRRCQTFCVASFAENLVSSSSIGNVEKRLVIRGRGNVRCPISEADIF